MYLITINTSDSKDVILVGIYERISGPKGFQEEFKQILPSTPTIGRRLKTGAIEYDNIIVETAGREVYMAEKFKIQKIERNRIININLNCHE